MREWLTIGQAAKASGLTAKMIRHYEALGLIVAMPRTEAGYRLYSPQTLHVLRFIKQGRDLGFSIAQIQGLLTLWLDTGRPSREVKGLAAQHLTLLDQKIRELEKIKAELALLVSCCKGDERPDCPILDRLANPQV